MQTPLVILIYSGSCLFGVCYVANITKLPAFSLYLLRWVSIAPTYCAPHGNLMICKIRLQACVLLPVCVERIINFQLWVSTAHLVCHVLVTLQLSFGKVKIMFVYRVSFV